LFVDSSLVAAAAANSSSVYSSLINNFPDFTAVCDVAVVIPLYSYIDSIRNLFVIMSSSDRFIISKGHAIITILSVVKFVLYYIILEESVYFYNPDHVKSDYFYRKG
jgi:hypothetical protein